MATVLVAGGCGFIGHRVSCQLRDAGHHVEIVDTQVDYGSCDPARYSKILDYRLSQLDGIPVHDVDVRDEPGITSLLEAIEPEFVVQLANLPIASVAEQRPLYGVQEITGNTVALLEASRRIGLRRFVYVSSSMVYGDFGADPVDEQRRCEPREIYAAMKLGCERLVRLYTERYGLDHTIVRLASVYGPAGHEASVFSKYLRASREGGVIHVFGEDARIDFTFVEDAAEGIARATLSEKARNEVFNIARGDARRVLAAANWFAERFPGVEIVVEDPKEHSSIRGCLDITKARRLLGFEPRYSMEEGLDVFRAFEEGSLP